MPPNTPAEFDRAYRAPITLWGDVRIPAELKALAQNSSPRSSLELGCGLGRFSSYLAAQGVRATAIDWSPVAVAKAKARTARAAHRPDFQVGDVTNLSGLTGPFDVAFDVGCFHCLEPAGEQAYVRELARLLKPGGTLLIWALDSSPGEVVLTPDSMTKIFAPQFHLVKAETSRRRIVASHWYWLQRN